MREYDLTLIIHPDATLEAVTSVAEALTDIINDAGGEIHTIGQLADNTGRIVERTEGDWQKRKLAYPIQNELEGYYLVLKARFSPDILNTLERNLKLNESVIRYLTVRVDE